MTASKIVDIPIKMEKFYGKGTMLHPAIVDVEQLIKTIPKGKISTINALTKRLSKDFKTDVTCPMRTGNAIKRIAERYTNENIDFNIPFWRVVRSDKMMIKFKNYEFWAAQIKAEGFPLIFTKSGAIQVHFNIEKMFLF